MQSHSDAADTIIDLVDFNYSPNSAIDTDTISKLLKRKLREQPKIPFSLQFSEQTPIELNKNKAPRNCVLCHEMKWIIVGISDGLLFIHKDTKKVLFKISFCRVYSLYLDERKSEKHLYCSTGQNNVRKIDLLMIEEMRRKSTEEEINLPSSHESVLWISERLWYPWGVSLFEDVVLISDYADGIILLNPQTGKVTDRYMFPLFRESMYSLILSSRKIISIQRQNIVALELDQDCTKWVISKQIEDASFGNLFGAFYEAFSGFIYTSDNLSGTIRVFDGELQLIKTFKNKELESVYGICINEKNGEMYLANESPASINVFL